MGGIRGHKHWSNSKAKKIALRDIQKECGEGKLFTKNYIPYQTLILKIKNIPADALPNPSFYDFDPHFNMNISYLKRINKNK